MFRGSVLLCALLFNAPVIWQALEEQTVSLESATIHFLITVPVMAILLGLLRRATQPQRKQRARRRRKAESPD
jgi:hypothetical protein